MEGEVAKPTITPTAKQAVSVEVSEGGRGVTEQIFQYLERRIDELDKVKGEAIKERPKGLSEREARIFRLLSSGRGIHEIGLRLLMDPLEVQEVAKALIRKGYLDENFKPIRREAEKTSEKREAKQPETAKARVEERPPTPPTGYEAEMSEAEILERLLASKMREELKRRIHPLREEGKEREGAEKRKARGRLVASRRSGMRRLRASRRSGGGC